MKIEFSVEKIHLPLKIFLFKCITTFQVLCQRLDICAIFVKVMALSWVFFCFLIHPELLGQSLT